MFKPVKTTKIYEEIIQQIKKLIVVGKLQPGDKLLSERELSEKLAVSRPSVREAFSALEMMGIIEIRPGEGSFVRQISYEGMLEPLSFLLQVEIDDILQLLEVRKILEIETAALAAIRASSDDIKELAQALDTMKIQVGAGEIGDGSDAAFHFTIARASGNAILVRVMNSISDLMTNTFKTARQKLFLVEDMPDILYHSHELIFTAIAGHNPQLARRYMREHLILVEDVMKGLKTGGMTSVKKMKRIGPEHEITKDFGFPS